MAETQTTPSVTATVVGVTDVGRVREHNEDSFLVMNRTDGRRTASGEVLRCDLRSALVFAVCDGMGGAAAGEVASRLAAGRLAEDLGAADFTDATPDQVAALLDKAVQRANADVLEAAKRNSDYKGMGTTLTAAVATPGRLFISQVGDSRAYLLRKGQLNQLTKDQSLIGQLIEEGTLTEEEAEKLGGRNIVLQAVGVEENLRVDTKHWPVLRGDVLLMCSDGLSGMVKDERIREILNETPNETADDLSAGVQKLVHEANENGGRDNITVVAARFEGDGLRAPMEALGEGEFEKAGAGFRAPPPPEVGNPMRRMAWVGGALLVVLAALWFGLRRTTADLSITVAPPSAKLVLRGAGGRDVASAVAAGGAAHLERLKPGRYEIVATAEHHGELTTAVDIQEPGSIEISLRLVPEPGTVSVDAKTPRVQIAIDAPGSHPDVKPYRHEFALGEPGNPQKFEGVPAGAVRVTASRPGFAPRTETGTLDPEGRLALVVPELDEVKGRLAVKCAQDGARVSVVDAEGEPLLSGVIQGGGYAGPVRVGRQTLRVQLEGFVESVQEVEIAEAAEAVAEVALEVEKVPVTLKGPPKARGRIEKVRDDGIWDQVGDFLLRPDGTCNPRLLEPGSYRVMWELGGQKCEPVRFEVAVGDRAKEVDLR